MEEASTRFWHPTSDSLLAPPPEHGLASWRVKRPRGFMWIVVLSRWELQELVSLREKNPNQRVSQGLLHLAFGISAFPW